MKKTLFTVVLIFVSVQIFAGNNLCHWRWRNNDGNEKNATWKAGRNLPVTISTDQAIRLRIKFIDTNPVSPILSYSQSPGGPYVNIKNEGGTKDAFVLTGNNNFIKHWDPTTQQIDSLYTDTFYPGRIVTREDTTRLIFDGNVSKTTEYEWVLKPTKYIKPGTTYYFRSSNARPYSLENTVQDIWLKTSNNIPHEPQQPDEIRGYNLYSEGKNLVLEFRTRFDGHDHFELEYSRDSKNWSKLKTIPGGHQHDYSTTLDNPSPGITNIYARLKLFTLDGDTIISNVIRKEFRSNADITAFTGVKDGNKVKFTLGVGAEYINPGFKIGRTNANNTSFSAITAIAGRGTSNTPKNWTVYDNAPASGTNRYVLQYYKNGVISYKLITVNFNAGNTVANDDSFSIYPNPASSGKISFDLKGYSGKNFTAKLTNLNGKQISSETFTVSANGTYALKSNAAAGTYVLNVTGQGLAKNGKVIVQ